jgi:hypothetical protein
MSKTRYIVVDSQASMSDALLIAQLLDEGYALLISWVAGTYVHHILTKESD